MKVLVLGGDGFIGSHMVDKLISLGHEVTVFDRTSDDRLKNLSHVREKINLVTGEFGNLELLKKTVEGQDFVYHFISCTTPATSWGNPVFEVEENLLHSLRFFEIAEKAGIKKLIFPSSGGTVYGRQSESSSEETVPMPFNPYGIVKLCTEHFLNYFKAHGGMNFDVYRISNPFGLRQPMVSPQGVVAVWMRNIIDGKEIQVYGDSRTVRDYIFVNDAVHLMSHSLSEPDSSGTYNICAGKGHSIFDLLEIFKEVIDRPFQYKTHHRRDFDNPSVLLDNTKILSKFPGFAISDLEEKLRETWMHVKETTKAW